MSHLTRIQPQVSLIINYTGIQQTVDYKRVLLKEIPFPFHAVCNGTTWKRNVTRPEKENNFFTQERWRLQEDQQMCFTHSLLISQNTVAKVVQTFKKDGTATISQRRPGRPRKLTPRQERLLKRRQGSRVRPIWSHMRPNFSRVRLKKNFSRTGAPSHLRKQNKSLRDSESLSAVRQQTR